MAPSPSRPVGLPYQELKAHANRWSLSYADTRSTSSLPMPPAKTRRPDGHPVRDESLAQANHTTPRERAPQHHHRTADRPTIAPTAAEHMRQFNAAMRATRPTLLDRIEDFVMALPLSAGDKAFDYTIVTARKLGRAASKRIERLQQQRRQYGASDDLTPLTPRIITDDMIGEPILTHWDNLDEQRVVDLQSAQADHLARQQEWQQTRPRTPSPPAALRPVTADATFRLAPAPARRPRMADKPARRTIPSTWGAVIHAANEPVTPPEEPPVPPTMHPTPPPRYTEVTDMTTRTQRKPLRRLNTDKPLPPTPRPESLRHQTLAGMRRSTVLMQDSSGELTLHNGTDRSSVVVRNTGYHPPPPPPHHHPQATHPGHHPHHSTQPLPPFHTPSEETRSSEEEKHPLPTEDPRSMRTGHVSTRKLRIRAGKQIDSWHGQPGRADSQERIIGGRSEASSEDGAAGLWRRLEGDCGVRMRE